MKNEKREWVAGLIDPEVAIKFKSRCVQKKVKQNHELERILRRENENTGQAKT